MANNVTGADREEWKERIFLVTRELEHAKSPTPPADEEIREKLKAFEGKMYDKFKADRDGYLKKVTDMFNKIQTNLTQFRNEQAAAGVAQSAPPQLAPPPTSAMFAPVPVSQLSRVPSISIAPPVVAQHAPVQAYTLASTTAPKPTTTARPSSSSAPHQTAPVPQPKPSTAARPAPAQQARPPQRSNVAVPPQQHQPVQVPPKAVAEAPARPVDSAPAQLGAVYREIEDLREPLEKCRAILRVFNVFGVKKEEQSYKEDFLKSFTSTTELVKKKSQITDEQRRQEVERIGHELQRLRDKLDRRFKEIMELCGAETEAEVIALDLQPFAFLERIVRKNGSAKIASRCRQASWILGGREVLKRVKTKDSSS